MPPNDKYVASGIGNRPFEPSVCATNSRLVYVSPDYARYTAFSSGILFAIPRQITGHNRTYQAESSQSIEPARLSPSSSVGLG
jgi:hypothetical protein